MARLTVPDGPGGEAAMIWTLRAQLGSMVARMIRGAAVFLGLGRSLAVLGVDQSCAI